MNRPDELEPTDDEVEQIDPNHPASIVQCDHPNCQGESPGKQRLCDDCIIVMHPKNPDDCPACGTSL